MLSIQTSLQERLLCRFLKLIKERKEDFGLNFYVINLKVEHKLEQNKMMNKFWGCLTSLSKTTKLILLDSLLQEVCISSG